ncbi:4-oxalocrotonate tautomerase family protein [uncultured Psychroserpens sp.]|uniref:tautomerase family protein n=1 Tax=uncultured Psychroserpens sp. TaxID=255436 RepID=UPI00263185F1|nr:4-oxalocrotonate tautomerase family protein [uncultured Psychroserpens sp.]
MPYINIKVTDEQVTMKQKQQLIEGTTQLLVDILNKDPQTTHVVIEEIALGNWGHNGKQYLGTKTNSNEK